MPVLPIVIVSNFLFLFLWIAVELHRRKQGETPEVPFSLLLLFMTLNTLLFDQIMVFRLGCLMVLMLAVYEARNFVLQGASELSLVGAVVTASFGVVVLTVWAVVLINEHLNLAMG